MTRSRRPKTVPPDSYKPHSCVLLSIDGGRVMGAAVGVSGRKSSVELVHAGQVPDASEKAMSEWDYAELARAHAKATGFPVVVVAEKWSRGDPESDPRATDVSFAQLNASWGRWELVLEEVFPEGVRVVRVFPATWRARILEHRYGTKSEEWKQMAVTHVLHAFGLRLPLTMHNAAEAVCQMEWASRSGAVATALAKPLKKKRAPRESPPRRERPRARMADTMPCPPPFPQAPRARASRSK